MTGLQGAASRRTQRERASERRRAEPRTADHASGAPPERILIAGGYGTVGRRIAALLALDYGPRLVVGGRNMEPAQQLARSLGHGVGAVRIDVNDAHSVQEAIAGVGVVISCVRQGAVPHLLEAAVAQGCGYTDMAPMSIRRPPVPRALREQAVATGARVIVGAGLVPGLSNMLARQGADAVGPVRSVVVTCLLSLGDEFGSDSAGYIADEVLTPFSVLVDGRRVKARALQGAGHARFPPPVGRIRAFRFPFSDQVGYSESLGARTAYTRIAILPKWTGSVFSVYLALKRGSMGSEKAGGRERMARLLEGLKRRYAGVNWWGVRVDMTGERGEHHATFFGRGQADATAVSAAAFVRALVEGPVDRPGIWSAEQAIPPEMYFSYLAAHGIAES